MNANQTKRITLQKTQSDLHAVWVAASPSEKPGAFQALLESLRPLALAACAQATKNRLPSGYELDDAIAVGFLAIAEGLPSYDPRKMPLAGWASWIARTAVSNWCQTERLVAIPRSTLRDQAKRGQQPLAPVPLDVLADPDREAPLPPRTVALETLGHATDASPDAEGALIAQEDRQALYDAVEALPALEKRVVRLAYGLNAQDVTLDAAEISEELGIPVRQVRTVLSAATVQLRSALAPSANDD